MSGENMNTNYEKLEVCIGYTFQNKELLINALTHTSYAHEHKRRNIPDNERLEFLGDAVLELATSEFLYLNMNHMSEGDMSKMRAGLVCESALALDAQEIDLPNFIYLGHGEEANGGRTRDSIVSDAFEALIGAIFLDGGIERAKDFVARFVLTNIETKKVFCDSKTILQERVNAMQDGELVYKVIRESGPDHAKIFDVVAILNGNMIAQGSGKNKKAAEQQAAFYALEILNKGNM